jgi:hypothetical protein
VPADRGLPEAEDLARGRESARPFDGEEGAQQFWVEHASIYHTDGFQISD